LRRRPALPFPRPQRQRNRRLDKDVRNFASRSVTAKFCAHEQQRSRLALAACHARVTASLEGGVRFMAAETAVLTTDDNELRRALGPVHLIALGIGAIIGAGIFVITGNAAATYAG